MTIAIGIILVIVALVLIVTVLMQDPEQNGMNALTGAAENFFGKKKAKGLDAKLALVTKICAAVFCGSVHSADVHPAGNYDCACHRN
jgi:protein translocase, SecG subunit